MEFNMWDLYNESQRDRWDDMERKYSSPENEADPGVHTIRCACCSSKIYPGDTIFNIDGFTYCAECVEESEYYA
jgi:hypothetical protein